MEKNNYPGEREKDWEEPDRSLHNHEKLEAEPDEQAAKWGEEDDQDKQSLNCGQSAENKQGKQIE